MLTQNHFDCHMCNANTESFWLPHVQCLHSVILIVACPMLTQCHFDSHMCNAYTELFSLPHVQCLHRTILIPTYAILTQNHFDWVLKIILFNWYCTKQWRSLARFTRLKFYRLQWNTVCKVNLSCRYLCSLVLSLQSYTPLDIHAVDKWLSLLTSLSIVL